MCNLVNFNGVMVADSKLDIIKAYVNEVGKHKEVKYILLYGDALRVECREESDIEILVLGTCDIVKGCDILSGAFRVCFFIDSSQSILDDYENIEDVSLSEALDDYSDNGSGKIILNKDI